ncbi:hypothetical protein BTM_874 [Burkholderia thailandensis 34]|uniref:hypothetical protein n=1 Tax=Burkholderia thailandensis TaxID=57975 RepID=UPI0005D8E119|nr:hypothetical protein [Burkholderia thailandensis]AJY27379.1 hypothetical protein BTM_874 [Burkholderia thailandensis 34]
MNPFSLPIINGARHPFLSPDISPNTPLEIAVPKPARTRKPLDRPPACARRAARAAEAAPAPDLPLAARFGTRAH